ncbi:MAG: hypothetical protein ABI602_01375 [Candidatus Saccharibacteria bacterium]
MNESEKLDNLVDTRQLSYSEAAAELGVSLTPLANMTAERTAARAADHARYADEFQLTGSIERNAKQEQIYRAGMAAVRAAIAAAHPERS